MQPLLVVDGDNLAHRAYHSTPKSVASNAIVGAMRILRRICDEEQPRAVFVAWDTLGVKTYRDDLWPDYQGGRVFEPSLVRQLNLLPHVCEGHGFGVGKAAGYEADDLMAAATLREVEQGGTVLILTTDKDSYQLVSDQVTVLSPKRGTRVLDRIDPREVVERMGVLPAQVPDFKALMGDSSDKIPGIKGIGPKAAASLLMRHGDLESVVAEWAEKDAELALRFREITRMRPSVAVTLPIGPPDWAAGAAAMASLA